MDKKNTESEAQGPCGTPPAIWDHTVLPATQHKWMHLALTPANKLVLDLPTQEEWKAELTHATRQYTGRELNSQPLNHKSNALTTRDVPNIRFVFASVPNNGRNSLLVFGRIASS